MIGIENNLYPPAISTWAPAFIHTEPCRVYFSLSVYNSEQDIKNVQVTITNQKTNESALNPARYPTGVMITNLQTDAEKENDEKYYIDIVPQSDIIGGQFEINQFYKVQLRFTGQKATNHPADGKIAGWLIDNQKYFSEWSRVCLLKGISRPVVELREFSDSMTDQVIQFTALNMQFAGKLTFLDENGDIENRETEKLKSYRFTFYNGFEELVFDSGELFVNKYDHPNEINYIVPYLFEENVIYTMYFTYTTDNEYKDSSFTRKFYVISNNLSSFDASIEATPNVELGCMTITLKATNPENLFQTFFNNIAIRRTSNKTDYKIWEDVHISFIMNDLDENQSYQWSDFTIESGVFYKYAAQTVNSIGNRSVTVVTETPQMIVFDDMFLTRGDMQVRLRYDPTINSFKRTVAESVTETIGSRYPFFRRNGSVYYKQFPISGLITWFCDEEGVFLNKDNIYKDYKQDYEDYNEKYNIDQWQDYIYERAFREKVMDFLYKDDVKLFRSTTEGNILIKLVDLNFTPNQVLGRMLYSFSATAYEIDECSIPNYIKYGILNVGDAEEEVTYTYDKVGQISQLVKANEDLFNTVKEKYLSIIEDDLINELQYFRALKLSFVSEPYLIEDAGGGSLKPWTSLDAATGSGARAEDLAYGWIVYINKNPIIVSPRGFFELSDIGTYITSISFPVDTEVEFDYVGVLTIKENVKKLVSRYYYTFKVGQLYGSFEVEQSLSNDIYQKYRENRDDFYQNLLSIDSMIIEAPPGTVIYVKDMFDDKYYRHIIGPTGSLKFYDADAVIMNAYIDGIHLTVSPEGRYEARDDEYILTDGSYTTFDEIEDPIKNGVYTVTNAELSLNEGQRALLTRPIETINNAHLLRTRAILENANNQYIWFNEHWYIFSESHDVICPVDAIVNYLAETVKGEY